ncbi:MAG: serine hydrolase family protein [Candidatus Aenigmarchaeota archaeon]|nr:serine hydrolase family protein [Candidatus Aenigmarchaeota archaeon]
MKRVFLIHGWEGYPEEGWRPWLKKELEKRKFHVVVPSMPDPKNPTIDKWLTHLINVVGNPDEDSYFVGHSLGCITILRYLESLKQNENVGGVILVAGFTSNLGFDQLESFFKRPIAWEQIETKCKNFIAIHSDNDPYVSLHYSTFFKEKLGAEIIIENNMKHFSGEDNITKLPVALESILKITKNSI